MNVTVPLKISECTSSFKTPSFANIGSFGAGSNC